MSDTLEQIEERARLRKEARDKAANEQRVIDLLAREALEDQHDAIAAVKVSRFIPGQPTQAFIKMPTAPQYKRFKDQVHKAAEKKNISSQQEAAELLAKSCWVYPAPNADGSLSAAQLAMADQFPGLLTTMSVAAAALAEGKTVEEGKG